MTTAIPSRMPKGAAESRDTLLLHYRAKDTPNGITRNTVLLVADSLGLTETQLVHQALAQFVARALPQYEPENGPLSERAIAAIRRRVNQNPPGAAISTLLGD
jgi:hypothetical protein